MSHLVRRSTTPLTEAQQFFRDSRRVHVFPASVALVSAANVACAVMMLLGQA